MDFKDKVAVITGGANGIGRCIADEFKLSGAITCVIDMDNNAVGDYFYKGDISQKDVLEEFADNVINKYGKVDYLINNACLSKKGILSDCSYDDFNYVLNTGVTAPYMLSKLFLPYFQKNACIINISSTRVYMSQPDTESYTAAKGAISALTHALAVSLSGKVRVNSISPGWIDTTDTKFSLEDNIQHLAGRIGTPYDIAKLVMFLCSSNAGFITGENINVDGGMSKLMIYHGDDYWGFTPNPIQEL